MLLNLPGKLAQLPSYHDKENEESSLCGRMQIFTNTHTEILAGFITLLGEMKTVNIKIRKLP